MKKMKAHITDVPLFEKWLKEERMISDSTIYVYKHSLSRFLSKNPDIDNVNTYNDFILEVSIKKRCPHYYNALKNYLNFKFDKKTYEAISEKLLKPKMKDDLKRERKHLSEDKLLEVINYMENYKHKVIALLCTSTGVRVGDVLRMTRGNLTTEFMNKKTVLKVTLLGKGKRKKIAWIYDDTIQEIVMDYVTHNKNVGDYYFLQLGTMKHRMGREDDENMLVKMNYLWYWHDLKQSLKTAGIDKKDFSTHDFRRCFARRVWEKWKDVYILQRLLNHSDPKATMRYLRKSGLDTADYYLEMQQ